MTDPDPFPRDDEAAEYVLGTLSREERVAFEQTMAGDPALAVRVRFWEERLVPLADRVEPVEPSPTLWQRISSGLGAGPEDRAGTANVLAWPVSADLVRIRRSRSRWRVAAGAAASLAAALALVIASGLLRDPFPTSGLVAVVNRSGDLPALIVRVDPRAGVVQVRALGAETPAGRSLELWSIVAGGAPRSLGVVAAGPTRVAVPAEDRPRLDGATIAVTVEPQGGSPSGNPTGPIVYQGRLVTEQP